MANTVDKVIEIAEAEVGYLEKATNAQLDSKTANAGKNNYTKYWRDIAPGYQGQSWCNAFINWIFTKAYGTKAAKALLCTADNWSFYTPTSAQYFKNKKQWFTKNPKKGDVIYFKNTQRIHHVGLVYKVDSSYVYTIEGNTSSASGVVANGGGVAKKKYSLGYSSIAGYGRPLYDKEISTEETVDITTSTIYSKTQFIKEVQKALGVTVDGVAGPKTLAATVTISASKNSKHAVVLPVQKYLNSLYYSCGTPDGDFGAKTTTALKKFQKEKVGMTSPDGEATAKGATWKKLLGL